MPLPCSLKRRPSGTESNVHKVSHSYTTSWKGETKVTVQPSFPSNKLFRDSGRLLFWTSHARLCLKRTIKKFTEAAQFPEWEIVDPAGPHFGRLKSGSVPESAREDETFSFTVVSRAYFEHEPVLIDPNLNVLLVSWDDREKNIASRICACTVDEKAWVDAEREWILVTL